LVEVKPEPAGETADGKARLSDIIVNLEEQKARLITYGGGYSTDIGANGFFDIRHFNLFGKLQQGGARVRVSRLQQLVQVDYVNPRFMPDGKNRFSPLTLTAAYQRDSTVTRFFRSTFDQGTGGIVQRIDEDGNPIDQFGNSTGDPTINRLTFSAETSRTISIKKKSFLFANYRFEDVRLKNFESLLVKDLLRPDSRVRISGFGANFVYDTRENCNIKYTFLELIQKGVPGDPCRYSASDPTTGNYLTAEYRISAPFLGANTGFHKFQGQYNRYYTISKLKNTTLAGRVILGLATVFSRNQDFNSTQFPDLNDSLPISERFFAGGSTTLRGFEFEGAGPRVAIVPQGIFRNNKGEEVFLNPFTVPFGGNALAIVNLEARIPVAELVRVVPFYDGGNVFRRVSDIFKPQQDIPANDVFRQNLRAIWSNTVGLGLRIKTPIGGEFAIDYGYLLNPPRFLIPQTDGTNAFYILKQGQLHFRFAQAF
jgi:outer membrane protein assembly factor BamA